MNKVTIEFTGHNAEEMAHKFFIYLVDGGLEDTITHNLSDEETTLGISDSDTEKLRVQFACEPAQK